MIIGSGVHEYGICHFILLQIWNRCVSTAKGESIAVDGENPKPPYCMIGRYLKLYSVVKKDKIHQWSYRIYSRQNAFHVSHFHETWCIPYWLVIMRAIASQITDVSIVFSTVCSGGDQWKHKAPRHWPVWGESTVDRWIPLTKLQWYGKCFHLMVSSCELITETSFSDVRWCHSNGWQDHMKSRNCGAIVIIHQPLCMDNYTHVYDRSHIWPYFPMYTLLYPACCLKWIVHHYYYIQNKKPSQTNMFCMMLYR